MDDTIRDGDIAYSIDLYPAVSADPSYGGRNAADVSVTNKDNEKGKLPRSAAASSLLVDAAGTIQTETTARLLAGAVLESQNTSPPVAALSRPIQSTEGDYGRATAAVDRLFGSAFSDVDLLNLLVDETLLPASPKKPGNRLPVDLALNEIVATSLDEVLINDLALALV